MQGQFLGYHSEWNLGSPGGWVYQKMAQEIGSLAWKKIKKASGVDLTLDFDHTLLNPLPLFAKLLFRAHKAKFGSEKPFIALVAEEETLENVGENIKCVQYLNSLEGVKACLIDPTKLEVKDNSLYVGKDRVTCVFVDFNNNVILKLKKKHNMSALLFAIQNGFVTNPRGMEPIGAKSVFEAITSDCKHQMSESTIKRTPWTRQFYPRQTTCPNGKKIPDLIKWTKDNWPNTILKPVHGYSGKGIIIGHKEPNIEKSIKHALRIGDYIVQEFIPIDIWAEEFPWLDRESKKLFIKKWQTDFRCFVTDVGMIGFVTRFGGIPTNVGSGGGVQSTAVLRSKMPVSEAVKRLNDAIIKLGFNFVSEIQDEMDKKSVKIGNVYLLGPIMNTLRPRIITESHIEQLRTYSHNLWKDALTLEGMWIDGKLAKYVRISEEEEEIARLAPWRGKPALIAADGLFGFR
ncbi:MAG: hypothetical protein HQ579_02705 [Candidatus Omnitrophica bacterium]|nr:hypothetical protein [Candidatus Omnitrophota bacterium]